MTKLGFVQTSQIVDGVRAIQGCMKDAEVHAEPRLVKILVRGKEGSTTLITEHRMATITALKDKIHLEPCLPCLDARFINAPTVFYMKLVKSLGSREKNLRYLSLWLDETTSLIVSLRVQLIYIDHAHKLGYTVFIELEKLAEKLIKIQHPVVFVLVGRKKQVEENLQLRESLVSINSHSFTMTSLRKSQVLGTVLPMWSGDEQIPLFKYDAEHSKPIGDYIHTATNGGWKQLEDLLIGAHALAVNRGRTEIGIEELQDYVKNQ